ncbi:MULTISPECIES: CBS domain-containing protein [unclassified Achromobacter]|uniref:CBS domain-containing protein n=1 Tax=unclassified Achromobacter TaxID=2626865 RepID=UPI000B518302|nr:MULTISPECIES: CBS domain-containing protein [unclassified Achromobacter]OWT74701.1 CBS domain-containing protein [Achromobacter sp. HZ34]OWT79168.1 CBS domain-containing protein [Achromobacter sp. HZ28]
MLARDIMTTQPIAVSIHASVASIMQLMVDRQISAVIVTSPDDVVIGIVSEGDIVHHQGSAHQARLDHWLAQIAEGADLNAEFLRSLQLSEHTAATIMSAPAITLEETATIAEVADVLDKHRIKRVPITKNGKLVGIVSRRDMLRALLSETR